MNKQYVLFRETRRGGYYSEVYLKKVHGVDTETSELERATRFTTAREAYDFGGAHRLEDWRAGAR